MDSALIAKYGSDFYSKIKKKADSICAIRHNSAIDLDGYSLAVYDYEPEYKGGDVMKCYNYIEDSLKKLKLLPKSQNSCYSNELILDAVITKKGKLTKVRVRKKNNPKTDSAVVSLLQNLPYDWKPAKDSDCYVDFRKTFYFFFNK